MLICALIAVQNATPVALEFFGVKTVPIPFGLMLTFATVLGMVGTIVLQPILLGSRRPRPEDD
jgi:lipopolysaccharide assembly protein A